MVNKDVTLSFSKGMKQTEIGLIPEDWEVKELQEIVFFLDHQRKPIKSSERKSGEYPYFGASGVIDYVDSYIFDDELLLLGEDGENILSRNLPLVYYVNEKCWINNHAHVLKCKDLVKPIYLLNKLESLDYTHLNSGTAQPKLNKESCKSIKIPLPPLAEQEAIANALSDADAWVEKLEQLIAKKLLIKQGAMQTLLTPKDDWEVKKLGEVCDVVGGGTPSTFIPEYWNGDVIWFTPTEVGNSKYLYNSSRKLSELGLKNSSATILPINTILLTSRAGIGDLGILKVIACTNQGFQSLICKPNANYEFVYYMMQTKKNELLSNASGSTFLEISPNKVKAISFPIPSLSEQERIATILSDMDAEIDVLEQQLGKAHQIKQGMMQELLTGKTRLI